MTDDGVLLSKKGKSVKGYLNDKGYKNGSFRVKGRSKHFSFHRLQAYQKFGDLLYKDGIVVRHLDGNKLNNSWSNIDIGTHSDNHMDIPQHIRIARALHAASFIRKHNKVEIIAFYNACKSYKKTMAQYNISSKGTLHFILNSR
jgi:hypothetical protein